MSQQSKVIDLTRGYVPGDPNAFPQNMHFTEAEDRPEKEPPTLPFEGYNFIPTIYGYRSYFGTNAALAVRPLESRAQFILLFQGQDYSNILIALCEDGIWTALGDGSVPVWVQQVVHTFDPLIYEEWTYCVIENTLYMYKQNGTVVYKNELGDLDVAEIPAVAAIPAVTEPGVPEVPATDMTNPSTYASTLTGTFGGTGGTDITFWDGNFIVAYIVIWDPATSKTSLAYTLFEDTIVGSNKELTINYTIASNTDIPVGSVFRVYIYDDSLGANFYNDYAITYGASTSIVIVDADGWTEELGTIPGLDRILVGGTPAIPGATIFPEVPAIPAIPAQTIVDTLIIGSFTPTFLNMAGQMGIFKAGTRLGFWDSANSVSWSSNFELNNFTPSLENLAGNRIFGDVIGRIVTIKSHGEGYIIYGTKSIVGVNFSAEGSLLWDAHRIFDNIGISYSRAVSFGQTDNDHVVFSTGGFYVIGKFNPISGKHENQGLFPEISDYLLEDRKPVYLTTSESRYLFLSLINPDYVYGLVSSGQEVVDPYDLNISWTTPIYTVTPATDVKPGFTLYEDFWGRLSGSPVPDTFNRNITVDPNTGTRIETWPLEPDDGDANNGADPNRTSKRSRMDNRKWIPLYHVELDRMRTNCYAWWMMFRSPDETANLQRYSNYSVECNNIGMLRTLSQDDLTAHFDAIGTGVKKGQIRKFNSTDMADGSVMPGIRAFHGIYGSDRQDNVQTLVWGQEDEWEEFTKHQTENLERIESFEYSLDPEIVISEISDEASIPTAVNGTFAFAEIVGYGLTGYGSKEILSDEGPYEFSAIEIVHRKTFSARYRLERWTKTDITYRELPRLQPYYRGEAQYPVGSYSFYEQVVSGIQLCPMVYAQGLTLNDMYSGLFAGAGSLVVTNNGGAISGLVQVFTWNPALYLCPGTGAATYSSGGVHTYSNEFGSGVDSNSPLVPCTPGCLPAFYFGPQATVYANVLENASPRRLETTTVITNGYKVVIETGGEYGYSQLRATVKHWDLIEPRGPYGEYKLIKRVAATAMSPITWDNHYPEDLGPNIWQMDGFAGQNPVDLRAGKVGPYSSFETRMGFVDNPLFDPLEEAFASGLGINSLTYQSHVRNGQIELGRYVDSVWEAGSFLRIDNYRTGSYIPGMIVQTGTKQNSITITLPGSSFNMQTGSIEASYPTFAGALVYDMQLKKWGKYNGQHYLITDINPLNSGINQGINYTALGTDSVVLLTDGKVYAFDSNPVDSWIRYGKIGYYRLGMTEVYEVKLQLRTESPAFGLAVQGSYDGKSLDVLRKHEQWFYDVEEATLYSSISGRWHVITISGNYDLTGLEFRGKLAARR